MTRPLTTTLTAITLALVPAVGASSQGFDDLDAAASQFPYEAAVMTEGVPVRSGPGRQFYETDRLARGSHVVVVRHDPGGWAMIVPPGGSYSLVPAAAVTTTGDGLYRVTDEDVSVRVGSQVVADHDIEQIHLRHGDRLRPAVTDGTVPDGWVAVSPPRGEYRWVPRQFVLADDPGVRAKHDNDPYAIPSTATRPADFRDPVVQTAGLWSEPAPAEPADDGPAFVATRSPAVGPAVAAADDGPGFVTGDSADTPITPLLAPGFVGTGTNPVLGPGLSSTPMQVTLDRFDAFLDGLDAVEPTTWDLEKAAAILDGLAREEGAGRWQTALDVRRRRLERLVDVRTHYRDYLALTAATDARDGALRDRQAALGGETPKTAAAPIGPQAATPPQTATATGAIQTASASEPATPQNPPALLPPGVVQPLPSDGVVQTSGETAAEQAGPIRQKFAAVGTIVRIDQPQAGMPPYVLLGQDRRVVAGLKAAPGIELARFLGTPFGVDGPVTRSANLAVPVITVTRLTPVAP